MKKIILSKGEVVLVDGDDFEYLNRWKWHINNTGYARRKVHIGRTADGRRKQYSILMHRELNKTPDGFDTDHINRNKLDNRKCNLRSVTRSQNLMNTIKHKDSKSEFKGVYWYKNAWVVEISANYKRIYLGRFKDIRDAVNAHKEAELKYQSI